METVYPQTFEIIGQSQLDGIPNVLINGREKYRRLLVQPTINEEDRNYEVIDEEDGVIYKVPEWMIPKIIEQIEYRRMTKDWKKTYDFNLDQQEILRILEIVLYKQGDEEDADLIRNQRLEKLQPEVYDYDYLLDYALNKVNKETYDKVINRLKPIYKLRNEIIPNILTYRNAFVAYNL